MEFNSSLCTPDYVQFLNETNDKWLQSVTFAYVAYGIELTFYLMCCIALTKGADVKRQRWPSRQNSLFILYITTMMILSTIVLVSTVQGTTSTLIYSGCWDPNINPAGPGLTLMGFRTWPLLNLGADGLLLWRCFVLYRGTTAVPIWVSMAFPCLLYIGIFATNIFIQVPVAYSPAEEFLHQLILPCFTLALNVIVTTMIVLRLLVYRHRAAATLGSAYGQHYTSITTILVESAALIVFFNVFFILSITALNNSQAYIAFQGLIHIQVLSPFFIIFRVAQGKAWAGTDSMGTYTANISARSDASNPVGTPMTIRIMKTQATDAAALDAVSELGMHFSKRRSETLHEMDSEAYH